jgi:hypothetical protein
MCLIPLPPPARCWTWARRRDCRSRR